MLSGLASLRHSSSRDGGSSQGETLMPNSQLESMTIRSEKGTPGYVSANELEMDYELHGAGQALVLLHGAFSAIGSPAHRI